MDTFSIFDYNNLSDSQKEDFNKSLAQRLSSLVKEINKDDVIGSLELENIIASPNESQTTINWVSDLYSKVSAGIQVGSGNQNLFHAVLNAFTESWKQINK